MPALPTKPLRAPICPATGDGAEDCNCHSCKESRGQLGYWAFLRTLLCLVSTNPNRTASAYYDGSIGSVYKSTVYDACWELTRSGHLTATHHTKGSKIITTFAPFNG